MTGRFSLVCAAMLLCTSAAWGGSQVSVRLVAASNAGRGVQAEVSDVADVLRKSFVFNTYSLLASGAVPLPATGAAVRLRDYQVTCTGRPEEMKIHVVQGGSTLLNVTVNLRDGKPLILGGFPSGEETRILVFLAR